MAPYVEPGYWEPGYAEGDSVVGECLGKRLELDLDGTRITIHPPNVACAPYPWLTKVGNLLLGARAGHLEGIGVGESANMTVELDNEDKQASELIGYRPRARAWLYDDDDNLFFAGLVQAMDFGHPLVLTLEA